VPIRSASQSTCCSIDSYSARCRTVSRRITNRRIRPVARQLATAVFELASSAFLPTPATGLIQNRLPNLAPIRRTKPPWGLLTIDNIATLNVGVDGSLSRVAGQPDPQGRPRRMW
jgi:hypothetical protein